MIFLELLLGFLKIGCFSFGGAYGAIPLIREVVLSYGWLEEDVLADMIAVSESTPGPIMVNMATYVGASQAGVPGALIATAAVVLPAFLIVILLMVLLKNAVKNPAVQAVLNGLKACVTGVILATGAYMVFVCCFGSLTEIRFDVFAAVLAAALSGILFGAKKLFKKSVSPIVLICIAGAAGVLIYGW